MLRRALALTLSAALAFGGVLPAAHAGTPAPVKTTDFADVSSNNPLPDVATYAKTHSRLALKVNEGGANGYVWYAHGQLADQAHRAGLSVWHYDFARPSWGPGAAEAAVLVREAKAHWRAGDRLVLDLEYAGYLNDGQLAAWVKDYAKTAEAAGLGKIVVYSGWWFAGPRPATVAAIGTRDFWFAAYQSAKPAYHGLHVIAWQYTDHGTVAGESKPVDVSHDLAPAPKPVAKPATPAAKSYPVPRFNVNLRPGSKASGSAVQWVQSILHRKPTGSLRTDRGLSLAVRRQQQGWGLRQTMIVDKAFKSRAALRAAKAPAPKPAPAPTTAPASTVAAKPSVSSSAPSATVTASPSPAASAPASPAASASATPSAIVSPSATTSIVSAHKVITASGVYTFSGVDFRAGLEVGAFRSTAKITVYLTDVTIENTQGTPGAPNSRGLSVLSGATVYCERCTVHHTLSDGIGVLGGSLYLTDSAQYDAYGTMPDHVDGLQVTSGSLVALRSTFGVAGSPRGASDLQLKDDAGAVSASLTDVTVQGYGGRIAVNFEQVVGGAPVTGGYDRLTIVRAGSTGTPLVVRGCTVSRGTLTVQ